MGKVKKAFKKVKDFCMENSDAMICIIVIAGTAYLIGEIHGWNSSIKAVNKTYNIMNKCGYNVVKLVEVK